MSMESTLHAMREEVDRNDEKIVNKIRERTATLKGQSWIDSEEIAGPAQREARDNTEYFIMGLSRKLLNTVTGKMSLDEAMPAAMNITHVLANRVNIEMLDQLFIMAYLRGAQRALELTGQQLVPDKVKPTAAGHGGQPVTPEEVCPVCGEVHGSEVFDSDAGIDIELPKSMSLSEALREFANLTTVLGGGPLDLNACKSGAPPRG